MPRASTAFASTTLRVGVLLGLAVGACGRDATAGRTSALVDGPVPFAAELDISDGLVRGLSAMDAADLDGDGLVDVAMFEGGKHAGGRVTFAWYESPADPSGGTWVRHELTRPAVMRDFIGAARLGDVDGDGDPDLVVSMDYHSGATRSAYIYWLENPRPGGDTTGAWAVHTIASDLPVHHINDMELADMDGDGRLDVVVRALDPNQLHLYFQDSADSWAVRVLDSSPYGSTGEGFAVGDIDRSGELDITICGHWLQAPPNPRSQPYTPHSIDIDYSRINANSKEAVGDIDGDGRMDVIISPAEGYRSGGNHVLAWYRAPADPVSVSSWEQNVLMGDFNGGHTVKLADMDLDGDLDVVSGVAWSMWGQTRAIRVFFNTGDGTFGMPQTLVTGKGLYTGVVIDLGNDRDLDIVGQPTYSGSSEPYMYESMASIDAPPVDAGPRRDAGAGGDAGADSGADASVSDAASGPGRDARSDGRIEGDAGDPTAASGGCAVDRNTQETWWSVLFALVLLGLQRRRRGADTLGP